MGKANKYKSLPAYFIILTIGILGAYFGYFSSIASAGQFTFQKEYSYQAKITADPKEVIKSINDLRQDRQKMKELEETRKKADEALREVEKLRRELEIAKAGKTEQDQYKEAVNKLRASDYFQKGLALRTAGKYQVSIEEYTKAIELDPKDAAAYYQRGFAYAHLGDYRQAIRDYDKAIELDPTNEVAYYMRGVAFGVLGNEQQAITDVKIAARLGDKTAQDLLRKKGIKW